jgi:hypothetical protein
VVLKAPRRWKTKELLIMPRRIVAFPALITWPRALGELNDWCQLTFCLYTRHDYSHLHATFAIAQWETVAILSMILM